MAIAVNVTRVDATQQGVVVEGTLVPSGNYGTGGETVDFSAVPQIPSNLGPVGLVEIAEQPASGSTPAGYLLWLIAGSTMKNWLLYVATAVGQGPTQLAGGAYPAGLAAATIQFRAYFNFGV